MFYIPEPLARGYRTLIIMSLSLCPFDISVGVWAFVIGLSQISSFFSHNTSYDIEVISVINYTVITFGLNLFVYHFLQLHMFMF